MQRAIAWAPLFAQNYLALGEFYWRHRRTDGPGPSVETTAATGQDGQGSPSHKKAGQECPAYEIGSEAEGPSYEAGQALEQARQALNLDPSLEIAWNRLCEWTARLGLSQQVHDYARDLAAHRPGEARSFMRLAQALQEGTALADRANAERVNECLAAYDRALQLNPRLVDACDQKAFVLAEASRFDEAFAACKPPSLDGGVPLTLRARAAWLHARGATCRAPLKK